MKTKFFILIAFLYAIVFFSAQEYRILDSAFVPNTPKFDSIMNLNAKGKFRTIEANYHTGGFLYGGDLLNKDLDQFYSVTLKFGWQNSKLGNWSKKYGTPIYGFGVYAGAIGQRSVFGTPRAIFGFITFPLSKYWKKTSFQITPHLGLTYKLATYNPVTNPDNDAISSSVSLYFNMEFDFATQLNRELDLVYGIDFMHSSNGRTYVPNWGLNMLGVNIGLRYYHNAEQRYLDKNVYTTNVLPARYNRMPKERNDLIKKSAIALYAAVGTVENYPDEDHATDPGKRYLTNSVVLDYVYRHNTMFSFTGGLDYFRDRSLVTLYPNPKDWNLLGIHAGADFNFWRMAIRLQVGTYLTDNRQKKPLFLRPALQYKINDWLIAQVGLKTRRGFAADWIEWGLVFEPFRWGGVKK